MSKSYQKCECPRISYIKTHKTYQEKQGIYFCEISYDINECKNHPQSHFNRRNEVHRLFMLPLANLPEILTESEQNIFKAAFKNCQDRKISKINWDVAVTTHLASENAQHVFLDKFLQSGVVEIIEEYYSTKSGRKVYVFLTDLGYEFLKKKLEIIESAEQIIGSRSLIEAILSQNIPQQNLQLKRLVELVKDQLDKIKSSDPCWEKESGEQIKPKSVQSNPAIFYIITKTICTWIRCYRERMTKRELSCLSFMEDPIINEKDPSKVLDKYYDSLEAIIKPKSLGFLDLDDFGLTKTLETLEMSGSISITKNNETISLSSPLILLDSFQFQNIKSITTECRSILCVENLAVFTQLVYDKYAFEENLLIIFIHGKSSRYLQKILKIISMDEKKYDWWAWLDYDLGGVEIFQLIENTILPKVVNVIIPNASEMKAYRQISETERSRIIRVIGTGSKSIQQFGNHILTYGKVEQEYFIKDYKNILKPHFH